MCWQVVMAQVLAHAPNGQLPEELLWNVRMLLPREGFTATGAAAATGVPAGMAQQAAAPPQAMAAAPQVTAAHAAGFVGQGQLGAAGYTPQQLGMAPQVVSLVHTALLRSRACCEALTA